MNPDRHVYLVTAILAVVLGALVSVALPHIPIAGDVTLHSGTGASTRVGPGVGLFYRTNDDAAVASPAPGVGLRPSAKWLRIEDAPADPDTLRVATARRTGV